MSYCIEALLSGPEGGYMRPNGVVLATNEEAEAYRDDLKARYPVMLSVWVVETTDPATHEFQQGKLIPLES